MIIAAIHRLEYCRMFSYNTPYGPSLLQTLSLSSFHKISVSPDLMKLCASTKTHHIIAVDLGIYFIMFSSHYFKSFRQKSTKRVPPTQRLQDLPISQEEELERGRYGGLTRQEKGAKYIGPFVGRFSIAKQCSRLMRNIDRMNLNEGRGLTLSGVSKLPKEHNKPVRPVSDDNWCMPSRRA
uniref:Uncharacterized protein n=1 Tax=Amphimedon queenslandica TaxID=400682 RepID=A0A1X7TYC7_AMPQE